MDNSRERIAEYYHVLDQWLSMLEDGESISDILLRANLKKVAILRVGSMARHLISELKNSKIEVCAILDDYCLNYCDGIKTTMIDGFKVKIDAILYTDPFENEDILTALCSVCACKGIYIGDVIFNNIKEI